MTDTQPFYTLTQRPKPYWQAHKYPATMPDSLAEDLATWGSRGPIRGNFDSAIELFPAASYRYVLYGTDFGPDFASQAQS